MSGLPEYQRLKAERKNIEGMWDNIRKLIMPYRGNFFNETEDENSVNWKQTRECFDSTAVVGCQVLASTLHSAMTPMGIPWAVAVWKRSELNKDDDARRYLNNANNIVFEEIKSSNFDLEASETHLDIAGYGTSVISLEIVDEESGSTDFQSIPIEQSFFVTGHRNQIIRFYRRLMWTADQIKDKFGDATPAKYIKALEKGDSSKHEIVYQIYERPDKQQNKNAMLLAASERPVGYKYTDTDGIMIGEEGGYYEMPVFAPRWRRTSGSKWGNGPAMQALPDVQTLNELIELVLKAAGKVVDPANLVTERALLSDLDLESGGMTVVRDIDGIKPYESRARFDVSQLRIDELQSSIRRIFYTDQLELKDSPAMTATEVQVRYELMQRLLGPVLGRLKNDWLDPQMQRIYNAKARAGKFGPRPDSVLEDDEFDIQYVGPLARSMKIDAARSSMEWVAYLTQFAEAQPEIMDLPDFDAIARGLASMMNVPDEFVKTLTKVNTSRKERKEAEQNQQNTVDSVDMSKANLNNAKATQVQQGM